MVELQVKEQRQFGQRTGQPARANQTPGLNETTLLLLADAVPDNTQNNPIRCETSSGVSAMRDNIGLARSVIIIMNDPIKTGS